MQKLEEKDIVSRLQEHSKGEIYGAYYTRNQEYEYFMAKNMNEVMKKVEKEGDIFGTYPEIENTNTVSFRSDEWIIFGNADLAQKFKELLEKNEESH